MVYPFRSNQTLGELSNMAGPSFKNKVQPTRCKTIKEEESDVEEEECLYDTMEIDCSWSYPSGDSVSRKPCIRCGKVNHLYTDCKFARTRSTQLSMTDMPVMHHTFANNARDSSRYANMPFVPHPYWYKLNMPQMSWDVPNLNDLNSQTFPCRASNFDITEQRVDAGFSMPESKDEEGSSSLKFKA